MSDVAASTEEAPAAQPAPVWTPWAVAPASGFEVNSPSGRVGLAQFDAKQFRVTSSFRFTNAAVRDRLRDEIVANGKTPGEADAMVAGACSYDAHDHPDDDTDLASIPAFMRWFVNSYGLHTLAAIIHDRLIVDTANEGALRSDTLSDTFFREMMRCAGVPWLKRWIMWAAVAMRTRWAAGGPRRVSLVVWGLWATLGIALIVWSIGAGIAGWAHPLGAGWMIAIALVMPLVAAPLWGRQYGAGVVAAAAALWILPAALFGLVGFLVYVVLERGARAIRLR